MNKDRKIDEARGAVADMRSILDCYKKGDTKSIKTALFNMSCLDAKVGSMAAMYGAIDKTVLQLADAARDVRNSITPAVNLADYL